MRCLSLFLVLLLTGGVAVATLPAASSSPKKDQELSTSVVKKRKFSSENKKKKVSSKKGKSSKSVKKRIKAPPVKKKTIFTKRSEKVRIPATGFEVNPSKPSMMPPPDESLALKATPAYSEFDLPTGNQLIFSRSHQGAFFQPTFSGRTISAMFGCVRNPGRNGGFTRFHEGVDIRPLEHDDDGEPSDLVHSAGHGEVTYVCRDAKGSNYGKYIVILHSLFGPPFYTLYAHLSSVEDGIEPGTQVAKGTLLGVLGRTSSVFEIDQDFAHLHFEVDLMLNDRFVEWSQKRGDGIPRHGLYNGANLIGIDPVSFFQFLQINPDLGAGDFVKREKAALRVLLPARKDFSWIRRYPFALTSPVKDSTCAYEVALTYYGLPVRVTPRSRSEISGTAWQALSKGSFPLVNVDSQEVRSHASCKLLELRNGRWKLTRKGRSLLEQLAY